MPHAAPSVPESRPLSAAGEELRRAAALHRRGRLDQAEHIYEAVLAREPRNADACHLLGLIRSEQGRPEESLRLIRAAISVKPGVASFHHNLAGTLRRQGSLREAAEHFREAIRLKPDYGAAYQGLAEATQHGDPGPLIERIETLLAADATPDGERKFLHFAAGKLYDDLGEPMRAFPHYQRGNALAARRFDLAGEERFVRDLVFVYGSSHLSRRRAWGDPSSLPVFVVGMPRSGTSLVEQILASHSRVFGAGELPDLGSIARQLPSAIGSERRFPECMPDAPPAALAGLGRSYVARLLSLAGSDRFLRVVDKHPLNFRYLGLVAELLPNARIVHVRRDPRDTCLSCYFQHFTHGQDYSFDLETLGRFYRLYERTMEHWRQVLPLPLLELDYEALVREPETVSRRLIDFCELDWEAGCLEFQKTERPVRTASAWQVRQPIYQRSVGRWQVYAPLLSPLLGVLHESPPLPATTRNPSKN